MANKKPVRAKGKLSLSRYFQNLKPGDRVSLVKEKSLPSIFPKRLQGRTGVVDGVRGTSYMVRVKDLNKEKRFLIAPIHLKRILVK